MLATRHDQENLVRVSQRARLGKEDGAKTQAIKSPTKSYPKTPQRKERYNENADTVKIDGKAEHKVKLTVTPAETRARAPLGAKTTNAKATAFLTPARLHDRDLQVKRTVSPRTRRSKFKVHGADEVVIEEDVNSEREIEYMPPREVPLPDLPDEDIWPHDRAYPQFEGENFTKGWAAEFYRPEQSDDESYSHRVIKARDRERRTIEQQHGLSMTKSREAAEMLGKRELGGFAAATSASKAKSKEHMDKRTTNARHTVAKVTSNTTLGYSKGRTVSAARNPTSKGRQDDAKPLRDLWLDVSSDDFEFDARVAAFEEAELEEMEKNFFACGFDKQEP